MAARHVGAQPDCRSRSAACWQPPCLAAKNTGRCCNTKTAPMRAAANTGANNINSAKVVPRAAPFSDWIEMQPKRSLCAAQQAVEDRIRAGIPADSDVDCADKLSTLYDNCFIRSLAMMRLGPVASRYFCSDVLMMLECVPLPRAHPHLHLHLLRPLHVASADSTVPCGSGMRTAVALELRCVIQTSKACRMSSTLWPSTHTTWATQESLRGHSSWRTRSPSMPSFGGLGSPPPRYTTRPPTARGSVKATPGIQHRTITPLLQRQ